MPRLRLDDRPDAVARALRARGVERAWIAWDGESRSARASLPELDGAADALARRERDYRRHEAIFLAPAATSDALFGAFVHSCARGQAQGGLRHLAYASFGCFLRDGLRLSLGMARKCALAGLWWGGGKGVIARAPDAPEPGRDERRALYREYARFVTGLRGCYVTAEDAGTTPLDMAEVARHTRFATCIPPEVGGSGNPSAMTALGVVEAIEAALDATGDATGDAPLRGRAIAMQGAGQVGAAMLERLFEKDVARVVVAETSAERCCALRDFFAGRPLEVRCVPPGDEAILAEPCDVLVPNALGGVLHAKTIPQVRARIVCGAANNPLEDDVADAEALHARGIVWVPDFVANRMGIVACCDEQAGSLPRDPAVLAHLDRGNADSIYRTVRRILERAARADVSPVHAAHALADERILEPHPIHGDRARRIVASLLAERGPR